MKRFSLKSSALLLLPCLIFPLAALMVSRFPSRQSGIEVQTATRRAPTALAATKGADVGVSLKLNERPDDNTAATWRVFYRVDAGRHLLWPKSGAASRGIIRSSRSTGGAWHQWNGDFDLRSVPAAWGDVVFSWDAHLTHGRTFSLPGNIGALALPPSQSHRSGKIVLRRAGETLSYRAKVSRNPHLKLIDWEISRLKRIKNGAIYRVRLFVKRDAIPNEGMGKRFQVSMGLEGTRKDGMETGFGRVMGNLEDYYNFPSAALEQANLISSFSYDFEIFEHPRQGRVEAEISFQNCWPLKISVPFSDAKARVLLRKSRTKVSGQWAG